MYESPDSSLGERVGGDSLTMINSITIDHEIVGTNSRLTNEYQMSDPNLRWIRNIIISKSNNGSKIKVPKKDLDTIHKKLLQQLPNLKIIKNLIYLVHDDKFGNKRNRYVMPSNEVQLTIKELHCKETAGHLGPTRR